MMVRDAADATDTVASPACMDNATLKHSLEHLELLIPSRQCANPDLMKG